MYKEQLQVSTQLNRFRLPSQRFADIDIEFLRTVLPSRGVYCAWVKEPSPRNFFFATIDDLARWASAQAERRDVYHACGTFRDPSSRETSNAIAFRSLWVDIDCGDGKPYPYQNAALEDLLQWLDAAGWPWPTYTISSGGGVHVYWSFDRDLQVSEWRPLALALTTLLKKHKLRADTPNTAKGSQVLRPVGSHNYKLGSANRRLVHIFQRGPIYCVKEIRNLFPAGFDAGYSKSFQKHEGRPVPEWLLSPPPHILEVLRAYSPEQAEQYCVPSPRFDGIAHQCRQMYEFARARGNVSEPVWYAALGVLAFVHDGEQLAHELSAGHAGYSFDETSAKYARAAGLDGPSRCDRFRSLENGHCAGCPHFVHSPIALGDQ